MTTKEKIEVMQASLNGKTIEVQLVGSNEWVPVHQPVWNWDAYNYRVNPLPRQWWINRYGEFDYLHTSLEKAERTACSTRRECIHVIEVLPPGD